MLTASLDESIEFVNDYAPEHLQLAVGSPFALLPRVRHGGMILLGQDTPFTFAEIRPWSLQCHPYRGLR